MQYRYAGAALGFCLSWAAVATAAGVLYVDGTAPPNGNGLSWNTAYQRLEEAISASAAGDEIRVAGGVYRPDAIVNAREGVYDLRSGVAVRGGYAGRAYTTPDARNLLLYPTTLSGDIGVPGDAADNAYQVVLANNVGPGTVLEGFRIVGGNANGGTPYDAGGGMAIELSSILVIDCEFVDNRGLNGGGLYILGSAGTHFVNCRFVGNTTTLADGGAVFGISSAAKFTDCEFSGNFAAGAGGAANLTYCSMTFAGCRFEDNSATTRGGGASLLGGAARFDGCDFRANSLLSSGGFGQTGGGALATDGGSPAFVRTSFTDNFSTDDGGAILNISGTLWLTSCLLRDNTATDVGGAIVGTGNVNLMNCQVLSNSAVNFGGAVWVQGGTTRLYNSIVRTNRVFLNGAGGVHLNTGAVTLSNVILWGNSNIGGATEASQVKRVGGTLTVQYACVQGWTGLTPGSAVTGANPVFRDPLGADLVAGTADDDLRLSLASPCVDAGNTTLVPADAADVDGDGNVSEPTPLDALGYARLFEVPQAANIGIGTTVVDFGPFETRSSITGDLNCDGVVGFDDIDNFTLALISEETYAAAVPGCEYLSGDVNLDGVVSFDDIDGFIDCIIGGCPVFPGL